MTPGGRCEQKTLALILLPSAVKNNLTTTTSRREQSCFCLAIIAAHCFRYSPAVSLIVRFFCALFPHYMLSCLLPLNAPAVTVALRAERTAHRQANGSTHSCSTCPSVYVKVLKKKKKTLKSFFLCKFAPVNFSLVL